MRLHTRPAHTLDRPPLKLSKLLLLLLPCVTSCATFGATLLLVLLLSLPLLAKSKLLCLLLALPAAVRVSAAAAAAAAALSGPTLLITTKPPRFWLRPEPPDPSGWSLNPSLAATSSKPPLSNCGYRQVLRLRRWLLAGFKMTPGSC
jgi:hypothetical protein